MLQNGFLEYIFTAGLLISLAGLLISAAKDRSNIMKTLKGYGFNRRDLIAVIGIVALFLFIELYLIKPTQLLFFDDAIYQAMAVDLMHMGQAWMCNYGTPALCHSGQIFHEPIGLAFNFAIAFLVFGSTRAAAHGTELALGALAVFMSFFAALLLLRSRKAAMFTALILALSPVVLVWAMPTNSDMAVLAYSLVAVFFFLAFMKRKNAWSLAGALFSFSLLFYMKVDELFFIPVLVVFYLALDDRSIMKNLRETWKEIRRNILNTRLLVIVLFFVMAIAPSLLYSYSESVTDGYGWQGTIIQNTCTKNLAPLNVTGEINMQNFNANACSNIAFWFNQYRSDYVMQPAAFTALAVLGAFLMALKGKRRLLLALGVWFIVFFILYTAFYAGSVIYGVDWRFMLSLIAQACMFGGFAIAVILDTVAAYAKRLRSAAIVNSAAVVLVLALLAVPIYILVPYLSVNPSNIQQAGDARFYENFVYGSANAIPAGCIVYTYDPTLFMLVNRTATQIDNLYNTTQVAQYRRQYGCLVLDYGYWCHTPNNECTYANRSYSLTPIATATYNTLGYRYGFYLIK